MVNTGNKNTTIRKNNITSILQLIYKEPLSVAMIAKKLDLSKPAVINILSEMEQANLVENVAENKNNTSKWRRTSYLISNKAGVIMVIYFAPTYIKIVFSYLNGTILDEILLEDKEFIDNKDLEEIIEIVNKYKNKLKNQNLELILTLVAVAAQVNKHTEEIENSFKFNKLKQTSIKAFFEKNIDSKVVFKNDINLAIIGEKEYNTVKKSFNNALLIYIDSGIGGAILNENKVLDGELGKAAEFGLIEVHDDFGNKVYFDLLCSINSIKKQIKYQQSIGTNTILKEGFRFKDVLKAFNENDNLVHEIVRKSAYKTAEVINNLQIIFNYQQILIGGRIKKFGEKYLNWITEKLNFKNNEFKVNFTNFDDESVVLGAIYEAASYAFNELIFNKGE